MRYKRCIYPTVYSSILTVHQAHPAVSRMTQAGGKKEGRIGPRCVKVAATQLSEGSRSSPINHFSQTDTPIRPLHSCLASFPTAHISSTLLFFSFTYFLLDDIVPDLQHTNTWSFSDISVDISRSSTSTSLVSLRRPYLRLDCKAASTPHCHDSPLRRPSI